MCLVSSLILVYTLSILLRDSPISEGIPPMKTITVQQAQKLLGYASDKSIYRLLQKGLLTSTQMRGAGGEHAIPQEDVEKILAHRKTPGGLDTQDTGLQTLQQALVQIQEQLQMIEERLRTLEAHTLHQESSASRDTLPEGYTLVHWFNVLHHIPDTTANRWIQQQRFPITRNEAGWKVHRMTVKIALSPEQQRAYYLACYGEPIFSPCEKCPHLLPEEA